MNDVFSYHTLKSAPLETEVENISPYLTGGPDVIVAKRNNPFFAWVPRMRLGSMPKDGGHLIFHTQQERDEFLTAEPGAGQYVRPFLDGQDFLNGGMRWCLWLVDAEPGQLSKLPKVLERVKQVRDFRLASKAPSTRKYGETPTKFTQIPIWDKDYLAFPIITSERRQYVPVGYLSKEVVVNNKMYMVPDADSFTFGLLQSRMHMLWLRLVSGRMKSDFNYGADVVYNTFPWPDRASLKPAQVQAVEKAAQEVLEARQKYQGSTLAQMYDPNLMPADLRKAHNALDRAVEALYGLKGGSTEAQRLTLLLTRYQELTPTLDSQTTRGKGRSRTGKA